MEQFQLSNETPMTEVIDILKHRCLSWINTIDNSSAELDKICKFLDTDVCFLPDKNDLFRAFELTPLESVRVVIIGQDPYPKILSNGRPRAKGLSFSVDERDIIPSSLKNIFKEIATDYPNWIRPSHGNLTKWAEQGVLMLNVCLTCPPGEPGKHSKYMLWMPFILKILADIDKVRPNCIYVMWGKQSQKIESYLGKKSVKLTAAHPSGLSASRGFYGCGHFKEINDYLLKIGEKEIEW
jgi:uracil-DNA glycosylase